MGLDWSDPTSLRDYGLAPTGLGLYAIGEPIDETKPVTACDDYDAYFGRWPNDLRPVYVGVSESAGRGVRGRLSSHGRKKGNKYVADRLRAGAQMWFMTLSGREIVEYEALLLCLKKSGQFEGNVREEAERSAKRRMKQMRARMGVRSCEFYDSLDLGEHGEGM